MNKTIETMRFKNSSSWEIQLEAIGLGIVAPGEEIDVPLHLCAPTRGDGGNRKPSPIESVAPQLKPVDPVEHKEWMKVPSPVVAESRIVSVNNNKAPSEPPGVRALRESLAAKKAQEATKAPTIKDKAPDVKKAGE